MRIVVLDGHTINLGDLSWDGLSAFGEYVVYERTSPNAVLARAADAEALLTGKAILDRSLLSQLPRLRYVGVMATGYNVVDLQAAAERGIVVTNVPAYSTAATAQATFALLLELSNHVGYYSGAVRQGVWSASPDFNYVDPLRPILELAGLTLGLVGYGNIGTAVARLGAAFGMSVLVTTRSRCDRPFEGCLEFCELEYLLARSDIVSLHCPLTDQTTGLINRRTLGLMKPSALLLNTARGPLVDAEALAEALERQNIAGAGLDVLDHEPPPDNNPLLRAKNCLVTPHNGWATRKSRERLVAGILDNLAAFAAGPPCNVVHA